MAGITFTDEELTVWQNRASIGPFKSDGDIFTNSPGNWDDIVIKANTFLSNPSVAIWQGPDNPPLAVDPLDILGTNWDFQAPTNMMCAAFVDLVLGTSTYNADVQTVLLAQATVVR